MELFEEHAIKKKRNRPWLWLCHVYEHSSFDNLGGTHFKIFMTIHRIYNVVTQLHVLLSIAIIDVSVSQSCYHQIRVILDCCSQSNCITVECCQMLGHSCTNTDVEIRGIVCKSFQVSFCTLCSLKARSVDGPVFHWNF